MIELIFQFAEIYYDLGILISLTQQGTISCTGGKKKLTSLTDSSFGGRRAVILLVAWMMSSTSFLLKVQVYSSSLPLRLSAVQSAWSFTMVRGTTFPCGPEVAIVSLQPGLFRWLQVTADDQIGCPHSSETMPRPRAMQILRHYSRRYISWQKDEGNDATRDALIWLQTSCHFQDSYR